jgi:hypothetical protein
MIKTSITMAQFSVWFFLNAHEFCLMKTLWEGMLGKEGRPKRVSLLVQPGCF